MIPIFNSLPEMHGEWWNIGANFTLQKPIDMSKASGVMICNVPGRGNNSLRLINFRRRSRRRPEPPLQSPQISEWLAGDIDPGVMSPAGGDVLVSSAEISTAVADPQKDRWELGPGPVHPLHQCPQQHQH